MLFWCSPGCHVGSPALCQAQTAVLRPQAPCDPELCSAEAEAVLLRWAIHETLGESDKVAEREAARVVNPEDPKASADHLDPFGDGQMVQNPIAMVIFWVDIGLATFPQVVASGG